MPEVYTESHLDQEPSLQREEVRSGALRRALLKLSAASLLSVASLFGGEANAQPKPMANAQLKQPGKPLPKEQMEEKLRESIELDFNNPKRFVEMPMNDVLKGAIGDSLHAKLRPRTKKGDPIAPSSHYQGIDVVGGQQTMLWNLWKAIHEANGERVPPNFNFLKDFAFDVHFSDNNPQRPQLDVDYKVLQRKMQEYFSPKHLKKYADYHATLKPEFGLQGLASTIPCSSQLERAISESVIMSHDDKPHMRAAMHNVLNHVCNNLDYDSRKKVPYALNIVDTAKKPSAIVHVRHLPLKKEGADANAPQPIRLFNNVLPDGRAICVQYPSLEHIEGMSMVFLNAKGKLKQGVDPKDAMKIFAKLQAESQKELLKAYGDLPVYVAEFDPNAKKKVTVTQQKPGEVAALEPK